MAWYDIFDDDEYGDDDGWGITYDTGWDDSGEWYDEYSDGLDAAYDAGDASWYDDLGTPYSGPMTDRWDTGFGGQANPYTGIGSTLGDLGSSIGKYTGSGSFLGGLFGGKDGSIGGSDLMGYLGTGIDTYMGKRENDRYNEMMQPMTDLYKAQAADVQNRRDNRDANLAAEYSEWEGLMQPQWDRRDQRADNLRQAQGQTQSSTSAWNRAASEQARDATKLASRRAMEKDYETRTGMLGGQLSALNPLGQKGYLERQENPWLGMVSQGITG
jgi:hypothetical protein